ncbi:hypothetical protein GCM10023166_07060 [Paeniglutamicibacter cryotolerans]
MLPGPRTGATVSLHMRYRKLRLYTPRFGHGIYEVSNWVVIPTFPGGGDQLDQAMEMSIEKMLSELEE